MRFSMPVDRGRRACDFMALCAGARAVFSTITRPYAAVNVKNVSTRREIYMTDFAKLRVSMVKTD